MFIFVCLPCFNMKATINLSERCLFLEMNGLLHLAETTCNATVLSRLLKHNFTFNIIQTHWVPIIKVLSFCYVYIQFQLMYLFNYIIFR